MRLMVRSGLVLAVALILLWVFIPAPTGRQDLLPSKPTQVRERTKATMEEKRENIRVSKRYAHILYKWGERERACLVALWTSESRFDHYARPKDGKGRVLSSAYGIAQLLGERSHDSREQILKGLIYISHRYDTPCRAKAFHSRHNWY